MKIILTGYMGSGKSTIGKSLATHFGISFLDLDEEIVTVEKKSISEIFKTSGEIYFRRKETELLLELLKSSKSFVLALGGGTPCYGRNMQLLKENKDAQSVYLKASLECLRTRLFAEKAHRPLISHLKTEELLEDFIRKHLFERAFYYNQSDFIVTTDGKTAVEIAEEIERLLK